MNLYIRLLLCILKSIRAPRMDILDKSVLRFHVLPTDLDFNMHMNNGRYLTIMDLGRLDVMIRTGLIKRVTDKSHAPVVGSAKIRFRLPLLPFQAYDLETQIIHWDEEWAYIEQRFVIASGDKAGAVAAIAVVKGSLYDRINKRRPNPQEFLKASGFDIPSPPVTPFITSWGMAEDEMRKLTSTDE
ncbi:MAG: thioesterase family protein [Alphaproteobacteria bacterium]|nr:thioesterase family protein [Alphaproteobacteria bacterium]